VDTLCENCGAELRLNPKLGGTTVSCPQCGTRIVVPKASRKARAPEPAPTPAPPPKRKHVRPYSIWLLGAQTALIALGLSCIVGAFFSGWKPPDSTYFREDVMWLVLAGIALFLAAWLSRVTPVLGTLAGAVGVLGACGHAYVMVGTIDASRTIALSVAMLALWLALQHRRSVT